MISTSFGNRSCSLHFISYGIKIVIRLYSYQITSITYLLQSFASPALTHSASSSPVVQVFLNSQVLVEKVQYQLVTALIALPYFLLA